jgi:acyl-CoA synthetase (AMP-forming)/AMP-acid ligase II
MLRAICDDQKAMDHDFHALRYVLYGASGVAPAVLSRALDAFGCEFIQTYGCTEIAPMAVLQPEDHRPDEAPHLLRSGGRAPVGTQVRIVDEVGHDLPVGEAGEIVARSMSAVTEYWGQPELSRARGLGDWLRTGDAGYKDEHGYVYVLDRVDDIIVTGGENVSSREVETVLYEHPAVAEVAVIGVSDEEWGSRIHAVVVPAVKDISPETLRDYCRERLAGFKVPKTVALVDSLPMNSVGKLLKREIRRQIEEGTWNEGGRYDENG